MTSKITILLLAFLIGQAGAEIPTVHRKILRELTWLEGSWKGTFDGKPFEATYTSPEGGVIMSVSKEFGAEEPFFFEFEKFEVINDTLVMTPYPAGTKSDGFPLVAYSAELKRAVFENKNHDFPAAFVYQRVSPDSLEITVSGDNEGKLLEFKILLKLNKEQSMSDDKMTLQDFHKKQAAGLFNMTWEYLEKKSRTPDEDEKMLQLAYASCYHWREVGGALNQARGEWMISHVNVILGRKEAGLHHAMRSLKLCQDNGFGDFDLAFGYEAVARALASLKDKGESDKYYKLALDAGEQIAEAEDKNIFKEQLEAGPWFGMR